MRYFSNYSCGCQRLYITAWPTDDLMENGKQIATGIYNISWIGSSQSIIKKICFIMHRSQKSIVINMGYLLPTLSLKYCAKELINLCSLLYHNFYDSIWMMKSPYLQEIKIERIREELKHMSFEDLQKLKEKLGTKVYNETIFGKKNKIKKMKTEFKRENKSRPREMSAKKPVPRYQELTRVKNALLSRDPRFDSLCGTYDEKAFKRSYAFINKLRENDLKTLQTELKETKDLKTIKKVKYLIQRLENQLREVKKKKEKEKKEQQEKKELLESVKQGEKPVFKKKSEKKVLDLVSQYEELKNKGKLKKHIQRLRKKNKHKDRIKLKTDKLE
ncbi:ribosomal RNA processing protein 36 homolog isoform X2 [Cardiocondyla obscurior]|uniref:ribosomal RNA processing protein 36 homolog isoform X2 n=1 Tax=Cardiocondyla obscurior TaxID=286306 RepID=UPI0039656575